MSFPREMYSDHKGQGRSASHRRSSLGFAATKAEQKRSKPQTSSAICTTNTAWREKCLRDLCRHSSGTKVIASLPGFQSCNGQVQSFLLEHKIVVIRKRHSRQCVVWSTPALKEPSSRWAVLRISADAKSACEGHIRILAQVRGCEHLSAAV